MAKNPKSPTPVKSTAVPTTQKLKENQTNLVSKEEEKKRILDDLKSVANQRTRLTKPPFAVKPIAFLDQLVPFIKVTLKLPKPGTTSFKNVNYDEIDLFFNPTGKTEGSYFNNYIKSFEYSQGGTEGFKATLSITDISFDFTDMLLLRFRSFMDTNLTFMDITFGWSTPEYGMKKQNKGVIFQNTVTLQVQEMNEEDSTFEREIRITGIVTSTFPDGAGLVMPYSILGPYPLITYNFIKYLYEPFEVQLKLMGLLGGKDLKKDNPKININKDEDKVAFVKNLYLSNVILNKTLELDKIRGKERKWMKDIFGSVVAAKDDPAKFFPSASFENLVAKEIQSIFDPNSRDPKKKVLDSSVITQIYYSNRFYETVKGIGQSNESASGNPINFLISKIAPILKETRIHPWEATKFFYYTMMSIIKDEKTKKKGDEAYDFIELDFADVINYSPTGVNNTGMIDEKKLFGEPGKTPKPLTLTSRVLGYNTVNKPADLFSIQEDPFIKVFGITCDSVQVTQATTWDHLLKMSISKVKVDITDLLGKKEKETFETESKKTLRTKKTGKRDSITEENNILFIEKFQGKKSVALKFANLTSKMFFGSKITREAMFETLTKMLERKIQNKSAVKRIGELSEDIATLGGGSSVEQITEKVDTTIFNVIKKYTELKTSHSLFLTISLDRSASIFDEGFGENNIIQAYNVRFKNSKEGFSAVQNRTGDALRSEFPDVVYFKPQIKNLFDHVRNVLPMTDMFEMSKKDPGKIISTASKNYDTAFEDKKKEIKDLEKKYTDQKTSAEERKQIGESLSKTYSELDAAKRKSEEAKNITLSDSQASRAASAIFDDNPKTQASDNIEYWRRRLKFPIRWNVDPRSGNGFLEGNLDGDAAMMKTAVTNLKRRMIIQSMSYEAELRVIGDPTFVGSYFSTDKLIFMKVLMADGRDSIHTGIYQISGISHQMNAGAYFTTFKLTKRPDLNGDKILIEEMTNSLLKDPIYKNVMTAEEVLSLSAGTNEQKKREYEEIQKKVDRATKKTKFTAEESRASVSADLDEASIVRRS